MSATLLRSAWRLLGSGLLLAVPVAVAVVYGAGVATSNVSPAQTAAPLKIGPSGLPVPRFVSLKADRVNVRRGPSKSHAIAWVFARQGLPVEIINEFANWRQVRDSEGAEGWVFHSLLSGRRTALVAPWSRQRPLSLRARPDAAAGIIARVESGVQAAVESCDGQWCRLAIGDYGGWLPQETLWGVYPGEHIE